MRRPIKPITFILIFLFIIVTLVTEYNTLGSSQLFSFKIVLLIMCATVYITARVLRSRNSNRYADNTTGGSYDEEE